MKKRDNNLIISSLLLKWYNKNKRDLPWRNTSDPYIIWISEIILQQTRVNQGWSYFLRFIEKFPDVQSLAAANEDEVLKIWQGLGYYSRARNLHTAAKQITTQFDGNFPHTYPDILSLKGVGEYTASAIASIAYNLPHAVVDGNVFRVISRLFAIETPINSTEGKKLFSEVAKSLLHPQFPGEHNQAMMELGALVCTPTKPDCGECPLEHLCMAKEHKIIAKFPVKTPKKTIRTRYFNYLHIINKDKTYITKRTSSDIWKNLYEFPLIETPEKTDLSELVLLPEFSALFESTSLINIHNKLSIKHVLSHQHIFAVFYQIEIEGSSKKLPHENILEIPESELSTYPISRLTHKYLEIK